MYVALAGNEEEKRTGWAIRDLGGHGPQPPEHQFVKTLITGKVLICADGLCNSESHDVTSQLVFYQLLETALVRHTKAAQRRQLNRGTCNPWTTFLGFFD